MRTNDVFIERNVDLFRWKIDRIKRKGKKKQEKPIYWWRTSVRSQTTMFALLFDLEDYATTYRATRDAYLKAANELKLATGPYKAARDAYVAATATYTKSLYE